METTAAGPKKKDLMAQFQVMGQDVMEKTSKEHQNVVITMTMKNVQALDVMTVRIQ